MKTEHEWLITWLQYLLSNMSWCCSVLPHSVVLYYTADLKKLHMHYSVIDCHIKQVSVCRWRWMCPVGQPTRQQQQNTPTWQATPRWMQTLAPRQRWGRMFQGQEMEKSCQASGLPTVPSCMRVPRMWNQLGTDLAACQHTRHAHRFVEVFMLTHFPWPSRFSLNFFWWPEIRIYTFWWNLIFPCHSKIKFK